MLQTELDHPWTLAELAKRLRIDRSYLVRRCRAATGLPPMAHLARLRAERAAELLRTTDWSVMKVGAAVGWPHPHHFARRFRARFACSPSAWRNREQPA
ncbi:MAG: helix-turn-helix transcriptional regulator [Planctomycetes bacterium]|nr:helix-turn-helix transcriptional regulator [Planctomycetota bacterium]